MNDRFVRRRIKDQVRRTSDFRLWISSFWLLTSDSWLLALPFVLRPWSFVLKHRLHRIEDRLGFHHHAAAAAVRHVVGYMMFVRGVIANIVEMNAHELSLLGALEDGLLQISGADVRKKGEEVKAQWHGGIVVRSPEGHKPGVSVLESFHADRKEFNHGLHPDMLAQPGQADYTDLECF